MPDGLHGRAARILPLHGGTTFAPSSVLVRAALEDGLDVGGVRAAVALFAAVCDQARTSRCEDGGRWWTDPLETPLQNVAEHAVLSYAEATRALEDLEQARLLIPAERGYRIEADCLFECPAMRSFDLDGACGLLRERGQLVGPATALLREIVREADASGVARTTFPRLIEATLFGRTRLTQALGVLERLGIVQRSDLVNRMMRLHLRSTASPPSGGRDTASTPASRPSGQGSRMRLPTSAPIQIAGETLEVPPGMQPELERGSDGSYYLWIGPVRVGPYSP